MAYQRYDQGSEGTTIAATIAAGTNRMAILAFSCECATTLPTSVTCSIGGQSCTAFGSPNPISVEDWMGLYCFYANDATLSAASNGNVTFTITGGSALTDQVPMYFQFSGRSQSAPTFNADAIPFADGTAIFTASVTATGSNADLLGVMNQSGGGTETIGGDLTTTVYRYNDDATTASAYGAGLAAGTRTVTFTNNDVRRGVVAAVLMEAAGAAGPTITNAGDELFYHGETGIVLTGTGFGATQGGSTVTICSADTFGHASATVQTITAWGDTSITITANRGTLTPGATLYLFVENAATEHNASGYPVVFSGALPIFMAHYQ